MNWLVKIFFITMIWIIFHKLAWIAIIGTFIIMSLPSPRQRREQKLAQLLLLRLELKKHYQQGQLDLLHYQNLTAEIDNFAVTQATPSKTELKNTWQWLNQTLDYRLGEPPWLSSYRVATPITASPETVESISSTTVTTAPVPLTTPPTMLVPVPMETAPTTELELVSETLIPPSVNPPVSAPVETPQILAATVIKIATPPAVETLPETSIFPTSTGSTTPGVAFLKFWRSGLSRLHLPRREIFTQILLPFLWQNIGWFIGGFCFVAGSIFLVANTAGFWKALTLFLTINLYTVILFGGGYQLRRRRQELATSSQALFILGVLLVPLNFAAGVRLIDTGMPNLFYVSLSLLLSLLTIGGLTLATKLASGALDRSLFGNHPLLFIAIAALQFALPILHLVPHWSLLAGLHLSILGLLGYALFQFAQQWLHRLFVERQLLTYYAAGTLVYAAVVSFIHLTWGRTLTLPPGYSGPFLLVVCGLLFYVDLQFKQWVHKQVWLSYFTFVIYALSILALTIAILGKNLLIIDLALILGILLYGAMVWHYLTWPPLYLLLAGFSGLYALVILRHFPNQWHFLLSVPGLAGVWSLQKFAEYRQAATLITISQRMLMLLAGVTWVWSFYRTSPGIAAVLTALVATVLAFQSLRQPESPYSQLLPKRLVAYQGYVLTALATMTWFYCPVLLQLDLTTFEKLSNLVPSLDLTTFEKLSNLKNILFQWFFTQGNFYQFTYGLIFLASGWIAWGLRCQHQRRFQSTLNDHLTLALLNSALLSLILAVTLLITVFLPDFKLSPFPLLAIGGLLLWLSLHLYSRALFYVVLVIALVAGELFKHQYLPPSSGSGTGTLMVAIFVWLLFMALDLTILRKLSNLTMVAPDLTTFKKLSNLTPDDPSRPFYLLGLLPIRAKIYASRAKMVMRPLQQVFYLLWLIGLAKLGWNWLQYHLSFSNLIANGLGAVTTILVAGHSRQLRWLPLALVLLLSVLVAPALGTNELFILSSGYASLLWWITVRWITSPQLQPWINLFGWQGGYGSTGGRSLSESLVHGTTLVITLLSATLALLNLVAPLRLLSATTTDELPGIFLTTQYLPVLFTLGILILFLWLASTRYRWPLHSYLLIGTVTLASGLLYSWLVDTSIPTLISNHQLTLIATYWTLGLALLAYLLRKSPTWQALYGLPLYHTIVFCYFGILLDSVSVLWINELKPFWLPWLFLLLTFGQLPLTRPWPAASVIRDLAMPLLLTAAITSAWLHWGLPFDFWWPALWGLLLWAIGNYLLPPFNQRSSSWAIAPELWLILGWLGYGWTLINSVSLFGAALADRQVELLHTELPWIFLGLAWALLPMLRSRPSAPTLRGVSIPLLLTLAVASVFFLWHLRFPTASIVLSWSWLTWSFLLWAVAKYLLPWFNQRWSAWAIAPNFWPVLGFVLIIWFVLLQSFLPVWPLFLLTILAFLMVLREIDTQCRKQGDQPWWCQWHWLQLIIFSASGLVILVFLVLFHLPPVLPKWSLLLLTIVYFLLLLQEKQEQTWWRWLPWLIVLSLSGLGLSVLNSLFNSLFYIDPSSFKLWILSGLIVWFNWLFHGTTFCQRYDNVFPTWGLRQLIKPFSVIPVAALWIGLLLLSLNLLSVGPILKLFRHDHNLAIIVLTLLINWSWLHILFFRPTVTSAHAVILSWWNLVLLVEIQILSLQHLWEPQLIQLIWYQWPLTLTLWTLVLLWLAKNLAVKETSRGYFVEVRQVLNQALRPTLQPWITFSFSAALLSVMGLLSHRPAVTIETLVLIAVLTGASFTQGFFLSSAKATITLAIQVWLTTGLTLLVSVCCLVWLIWLPPDTSWSVLLPWYALQFAILTWAGRWLKKSVAPSLAWLLNWSLPLLGLLSMLAWGSHVALFINQWLTIDGQLPNLFGILDNRAFIFTGFLLMGLWWHYSEAELRSYGLVLLLALTGGYTRILWRGLVPLDVWDTISLMVASYWLLLIQRFAMNTSWYRLTLLLPFSALLTIPWQLNSVHASGTLLATAALYLLMQRRSGESLPTYLALLTFNLGIYLWIPDLASYYQLLWIYTIPMSITVLMMLQLHWLELKPSVIQAIRLTALCTLYVSATLDVFLRPELSILFLILALSLVGIILGIALKVRAFLYTGSLFLILNIVGQLIQLYPEGRLEKAILLITVGAVITGGMIWFNLQREIILQRIKIVRADLVKWE